MTETISFVNGCRIFTTVFGILRKPNLWMTYLGDIGSAYTDI